MKKWLCFCLLVLLCACGDETIDREPEEQLTPEEQFTSEDLYISTGCRLKDISQITKFSLHGSADARYLYGSKKINGEDVFWITKFTMQGDSIWEVLKEKKGFKTYAYNPVFLNDNNLLLARVTTEGMYNITDISPFIISVKEGTTKEIPIGGTLFYDQVQMFDDYFCCTLSEAEENRLTSSADFCAVQISYEGMVLNKGKEFCLPDKDAVWIDNSFYIQADKNQICKKHIVKDVFQKQEWSFPVELSPFKNLERTIEFVNDSVNVTYNLISFSGETSQIAYLLSYQTGKPTVIITINFEEEFVTMIEGEKKQSQVIIEPEGTELGELIYSSSNPQTVIVDAKGLITAKSIGSAIITVTTKDSKYRASCQVNVAHFTERITIFFSGSFTNFNGYIMLSGSAILSNHSDKTIYVEHFSAYDGSGREIKNEEINKSLSSGESIEREVKYQGIYKLIYNYTYSVGGKQYEVTYSH